MKQSTESKAGGAHDVRMRDRLQRVGEALKRHRVDFDPHYRDLQANFMPRRGHFNSGTGSNAGDPKRGKKVNDRIINSRPVLTLRTLKSGMQAGMTSPARPWFRLIPEDDGMRERYAVRTYTDDTQRVMRQYLQRTGTYNALHTAYGDLGLLGTDCIIVDEDTQEGFTPHVLVPGRYWLGSNGRNTIDTAYMEDSLTVEQVVGRFVFRNEPRGEPDWDVVSQAVRNLWDKGDRGALVQVARLVTPRRDRDPMRLTADNKPVASVWWEMGGDTGRVLRDSGYDQNPIIASRWYQEGNEVYGRSPAMDVLADAQQLQVQERDKAEAIRRMNRPPLTAPTALRNGGFSTMPGGVTFIDLDGRGIAPIHEVNPPVNELRADIRETEERISEGLYANLFMMLANSDRRQITAREIDERHEEKLIGLGPVLELQHKEKLQPLIKLIHAHLTRQGKLPPVPAELDKQTLIIDYISVLAQAQKAVGTAGIERLYGFAGNLSGVKPGVLDNLNEDFSLNEYADMLGVGTRNLREASEIAAIRKQRAEQQAQEQQMAMMAQAAPAAKQGAEAARVLADASSPRGGQPGDVLRRIGLGA